jgi:hypothetical protein
VARFNDFIRKIWDPGLSVGLCATDDDDDKNNV